MFLSNENKIEVVVLSPFGLMQTSEKNSGWEDRSDVSAAAKPPKNAFISMMLRIAGVPSFTFKVFL